MEAIARRGSSEVGVAARPAAVDGTAVPRPARVLLVCCAARGGIASHVVALLNGLHADGYEVGVACEPEGAVADAARGVQAPVFGVKVRGSGVSSRLALAALQVRQAALAIRAQIIHTHSFRAGVLGAITLAMPLTGGARLVATIHNYPPGAHTMGGERPRHRPARGAAQGLARGLVPGWAIRLLLRRATRVIAVSEALRGELAAAWPEAEGKAVCIPNGVDTRAEQRLESRAARAALGLAEEGPIVGMTARLAPQKGVSDFLHAARIVAGGHPEVSFVLVGEGPLRSQVEALRGELNLDDQMQLVGHVASPRELMAALDVLVVASTSEGSSLAAMEAMAAGKPVVATAVGGVPEVVAEGETGLLVAPGDPEEMAAAIAQLLEHPAQAEEMGARGRRRAAAHFDVREMVARTKEVYADVIRESGERPGGPAPSSGLARGAAQGTARTGRRR